MKKLTVLKVIGITFLMLLPTPFLPLGGLRFIPLACVLIFWVVLWVMGAKERRAKG